MESEEPAVYRLFTDILSRFIIRNTVLTEQLHSLQNLNNSRNISESTDEAEIVSISKPIPSNSMKYAQIENENTESSSALPTVAQNRVHFDEENNGTIHKLRFVKFNFVDNENNLSVISSHCYVPISDFATRQLNLRKPQKSLKFSKKQVFKLAVHLPDERSL